MHCAGSYSASAPGCDSPGLWHFRPEDGIGPHLVGKHLTYNDIGHPPKTHNRCAVARTSSHLFGRVEYVELWVKRVEDSYLLLRNTIQCLYEALSLFRRISLRTRLQDLE